MATAKRTDPELLRQLDAAHGTDERVAATVSIRRKPGKPVPEEIDTAVRVALDRAVKKSGLDPCDLHVMGRVAAAYVSGPEALIREFEQKNEPIVAELKNQYERLEKNISVSYQE